MDTKLFRIITTGKPFLMQNLDIDEFFLDPFVEQHLLTAEDFHAVWQAVSNTRWRHQMETFSALLALCAGNSPVTGEFPTQRPVTRSFDAFFDLHLNKRLSNQSRGWWFEMPSCPLLSHCNERTRLQHHFDVIKWKHVPCYCPFVRGIHQWPVNSSHKGTVTRTFSLYTPLNKHSIDR